MGKSVFESDEALKRELIRCMKCGNCMAVCPVYGTEVKESAVARGKIALGEAYLEGKIRDKDLMNLIYNCLVCKSCMLACPTGVKYDKIILALRHKLAKDLGKPWVKKLAFWALTHPSLFDKGLKAFSKMQGFFLEKRGPKLRAPRAFLRTLGKRFDEYFVLPEFASKSFRDSTPEVVEVSNPQATALFFTGCSINYLYPEIGDDILFVLKKNAIKTLIPKGQNCCGMPVMVHGDIEKAKELAKNNLDLFERINPEYIITGCASCGSALKHEYPMIFEGDQEYETKAKKWAEKVYDITSFLLKVIKLKKPKAELKLKVTYHDPCHLKKSMKVWVEPRELLKAIPGVELVEMKKPDTCCGSGGSYHLAYADTSLKILQSKMEDVKNTKAEVVATECPACMMQLGEGTQRYKVNAKVKHVISLLAEAYRRES